MKTNKLSITEFEAVLADKAVIDKAKKAFEEQAKAEKKSINLLSQLLQTRTN